MTDDQKHKHNSINSRTSRRMLGTCRPLCCTSVALL